MERILHEKIEQEIIVHEQYCDRCGKHLGTNEECNDGWYSKFGEYEIKVFPGDENGWYYYRKQLCPECESIITNGFVKLIRDFGFKTDKEWDEE